MASLCDHRAMDTDGASVDDIYASVAEDTRALGSAALVGSLRTLLGARLVAYLVGASSTATVSDYVDGRRAVPEEAGERLRSAYRIAELQRRLGASSGLTQAWFQGANPRLGDCSPARVIVEKSETEDRVLLSAAIALVSE